MADKKYYVPGISEFHVGFEFESEDRDDNFDKIYITNSLDSESDMRIVQDWLDNKEIRVKYLDREDIESLGLSYDLTNDQGCSCFSKEIAVIENPTKNYGYERLELWLNYKDSIPYITINDDQTRVFLYKCLNKSKLKTILKDIGVIK